MKSGYTLNLDGMTKLKKQLSQGYIAKIGIMGAQASKPHNVAYSKLLKSGKVQRLQKKAPEQGITNVEIGIVQEYGSITKNIPARSFLREPIESHAKEIGGFLAAANVTKAIEDNNIKRVFQLLGLKALSYVQMSFGTQGYGKWEANKAATIARKGSSQPLIDTSQLRRAVSSEVGKV